MIDYGKKNAFQQQADEVFKTLPVNIRICENKKPFSLRLEVFIRIKPWLGYYPYKVSFWFSFHMFYLRFSFNYAILVSLVEYLDIFYVLISTFNLQPIYLICFEF